MAFTYSAAADLGAQGASLITIEDLFNSYKSKNTFAILYLNRKKANLLDMPKVINSLSLDSKDIAGVQRDTEKWYSKVLIKFKDSAESEYERMKDLDGEVITIKQETDEEVKIMVQDITSNIKYVAVSGVPFEVPDSALTNLMSRFGEVKGI